MRSCNRLKLAKVDVSHHLQMKWLSHGNALRLLSERHLL